MTMGIVLVAFMAALKAGVFVGDDHVNLEPNHLGGKPVSRPVVSIGEAGLNNDVLSLDVANLSQALAERLKQDTREGSSSPR